MAFPLQMWMSATVTHAKMAANASMDSDSTSVSVLGSGQVLTVTEVSKTLKWQYKNMCNPNDSREVLWSRSVHFYM